jgi:hypothetical protein
MHSLIARLGVITIAVLLVASIVSAQSSQRRTKPLPQSQPPNSSEQQPVPAPTPPEEQPVDTLKTTTDLVTVPVIAADTNGIYVPDLAKEEFQVQEDGTKQEIAIFATVTAPFHVVLMLDTSASTREKLADIQRAATAFVEQLQVQDRVKVISFNDEITDHNEFTNDRAQLRAAINKTRAGEGTKLYDAFSTALDSIRTIRGRKAIVLFTDGVDRISDRATYDSTIRGLDEEGIIVYPIRYDTRAETEEYLRRQTEDQSLPTIGVVRGPTSGTTAPTFPSDDPDTVPTASRPKTGPLGLPLPEEILRRRREEEQNRRTRDEGRYPSPGGWPEPDTRPTSDPSTNPTNHPIPTGGTRRRSGSDPREDSAIRSMLDLAYSTADAYLRELERRSGGKLVRADTLTSLPDAFAKIAAELRTQYSIGYYPINKTRDGKYRKIKVSCSRKNVIVRARPGYIASEN